MYQISWHSVKLDPRSATAEGSEDGAPVLDFENATAGLKPLLDGLPLLDGVRRSAPRSLHFAPSSLHFAPRLLGVRLYSSPSMNTVMGQDRRA